ncbi:unnamed protein product, partial [marine sediment metagenome]
TSLTPSYTGALVSHTQFASPRPDLVNSQIIHLDYDVFL